LSPVIDTSRLHRILFEIEQTHGHEKLAAGAVDPDDAVLRREHDGLAQPPPVGPLLDAHARAAAQGLLVAAEPGRAFDVVLPPVAGAAGVPSGGRVRSLRSWCASVQLQRQCQCPQSPQLPGAGRNASGRRSSAAPMLALERVQVDIDRVVDARAGPALAG